MAARVSGGPGRAARGGVLAAALAAVAGEAARGRAGEPPGATTRARRNGARRERRALPHRPQSLKIQLRRLTERSHTALETQWFEVAAHIAAIVSAAILSV